MEMLAPVESAANTSCEAREVQRHMETATAMANSTIALPWDQRPGAQHIRGVAAELLSSALELSDFPGDKQDAVQSSFFFAISSGR